MNTSIIRVLERSRVPERRVGWAKGVDLKGLKMRMSIIVGRVGSISGTCARGAGARDVRHGGMMKEG